jgi:hypothetical protein
MALIEKNGSEDLNPEEALAMVRLQKKEFE